MSDTPDYVTLVKLLPILRNLVDGCGEVTLTADEAAQIRLLGFRAEEGRWRVPPVPPELVADIPLLENLSIGWNPAQVEATHNGANTKNQSCEVARIIEGNGRSVLAAMKVEGIRQPIKVSGQKADIQATTANRIRPAPARTIRLDSELAIPSEHTGEDGAFARRRRAGYQLPRTPQEQGRMAEEAASRMERTLNKAYREGKRMKVRELQHRHWRFPASVFHQAMRILERTDRILYQFNGIRVTPAHYEAKRI
jgi:hypothetical protein